MTVLPVELLSKIFSLACTDTGKTGCSLSIVSHHIRDVSAEYRYQAVAATTAQQISEFHSVFTQVPARLRRVRYLYLYRKVPVLLGQDSSEFERREYMRWFQSRPHPSSEEAALDFKIRTLLELTAPTLETLSVVAFEPYETLAGILGTFILPRLRQLTLRMWVGFPNDLIFAPNVERLDMWAATLDPASRHKSLGRVFPRLTHLYLTGYNPDRGQDPALLEDIKYALAISPENNLRRAYITRMSPGQRQVTLLPKPQAVPDFRQSGEAQISITPLKHTLNVSLTIGYIFKKHADQDAESQVVLSVWQQDVDSRSQ